MTKSNANNKKNSTKTAATHSKVQSKAAKELRQAVLFDLCSRIKEAKSASVDSG